MRSARRRQNRNLFRTKTRQLYRTSLCMIGLRGSESMSGGVVGEGV